jgi:rhamnosyltransferase subunit B
LGKLRETNPVRRGQTIIETRRHIVLPCLGTDGDVYPFLGLGRILRARGHRVTLASHEHFSDQAKGSDLEFLRLVSNDDTDRLQRNRDFWHPIKGPIVIARWGAPFVPWHYKVLSDLAREPNTFLVASPGVISARVVNETQGTPLVSILLQPWMIPSSSAPPAMMGFLTLPRWAPRPMGAAYWRFADVIFGWLVGREFDRLRTSLSLRPVPRMYRWWLSPERAIGLFPSWYGAPQPDWPSQLKLTGFPVNDVRTQGELPHDLVNFCRAGKPPVAFTFGTGMMHASTLFRSATHACTLLDSAGIFLTKFRSHLPQALPSSIRHVEFAPFQQLFPLCSVVVHHGGIGTVAKALAAGTPQLILPFAFDQLDNAIRVKELGAGEWLPAKKRSPKDIAAALRRLVSPESQARARSVAALFESRSGLESAADEIEQIGARSFAREI